jgi:hypothetical protein
MNRTDVNNVIRENMASVRQLMEDYPWLNLAKGTTIGTQSTANLLFVNSQTVKPWIDENYTVGRRVKVVGTPTRYGKILAAAFSGNDWRITVGYDNDAVNPTSPTEVHISVVDATAGLVLSVDLPEGDVNAPSRGNLIADAALEANDLSRWETGDGSGGGPWALSTSSRSGTYAASYPASGQTVTATLRANNRDSAELGGQIACREGEVLYFSLLAQYSGTVPGASFCKVGFIFKDEDGITITSDLSAAFEPGATYAEHTYLSGPAPAGTIYAVPSVEITSGSPSGTIYYFDDFLAVKRSQFAQEASYSITTPTVASASGLTLPDRPDVIIISGTTDISSVTASRPNRRATLIFEDALTFIDGGNLKLAGNLVTTTNDTITLVCDGTDWYETARSVNSS